MVKIDRARKILYILEEKNYKRERMIIAKIKDSGNSGRNSGSIDIAYCIRYSAIKKNALLLLGIQPQDVFRNYKTSNLVDGIIRHNKHTAGIEIKRINP